MDYKQKLIELAIKQQALQFGDFTLKSGRQAPYFFNMGQFIDGESLAFLGQCYAARLRSLELEFDGLFGPAYKGIPLVATTAVSLATDYQTSVNWSFNRKEAKDHGEGGMIVGAPLRGKIVLLDDVISAGTAINSAMQLIKQNDAEVVAMLIALNRQECGQDRDTPAIAEVAKRYNVPVYSLIDFSDLLDYLSAQQHEPALLHKMQAYWQQYGCPNQP